MSSFSCFFSLISRHLSEGLVQLLCDGLELVLLRYQLVLQPVNLDMVNCDIGNLQIYIMTEMFQTRR
jgi:hypothetical protein